LFAPVLLLKYPLERAATLGAPFVSPLLPDTSPAAGTTPRSHVVRIALEDIENPAMLGLEIGCESYVPFLTIRR
jgi:hypothetical protein